MPVNRAVGAHGSAEKHTRSVHRVCNRPSSNSRTSCRLIAASLKSRPPNKVRPASISTLFR